MIVADPANATTVIHALLADPLLTVSVPPLARLIDRADVSDTVVAATTVSYVLIVPASPVPGMSCGFPLTPVQGTTFAEFAVVAESAVAALAALALMPKYVEAASAFVRYGVRLGAGASAAEIAPMFFRACACWVVVSV